MKFIVLIFLALPSISKAAALSCAARSSDPGLRAFINLEKIASRATKRARVNLRKPFARFVFDASNSQISGIHGKNGPVEAPQLDTLIFRMDLEYLRKPEVAEQLAENALVMSFDQIADFEEREKLQDLVQNRKLTRGYVKAKIDSAFNYLYGGRAYGTQPGRQEFLEDYNREDVEHALRTTHFLQIRSERVVSHSQAQTSSAPNVKFNFETHFNTSEIIKRVPGRLGAEFGRLGSVNFELLKSEDLEKAIKQGLTRQLIFNRQLQKMTTWALHDAVVDDAYFQCNDGVLKLLERAIRPVKLLKKFEFPNADPEKPSEWIIEMNRPNLEAVEKVLMIKNFVYDFSRALKIFKNAERKDLVTPHSVWQWLFWPSEAEALQSAGVITEAVDYQVRTLRGLTEGKIKISKKTVAHFRRVILNRRYISLDYIGLQEVKMKLEAQGFSFESDEGILEQDPYRRRE